MSFQMSVPTPPTILEIRHKLEAQGDESSMRVLSQVKEFVREKMKM